MKHLKLSHVCMCVCIRVYTCVCVDQEERRTELILLSACYEPSLIPTAFQGSPRKQILLKHREVGYLPKVTASGSGRAGTPSAPLRNLRAQLWQSAS